MSRLGAHPYTRAGLGLGILSALVAMFCAGGVVVHGPARGLAGTDTDFAMPAGILLLFIAVAILLGVAMALDARWAAIAGTGLVAGAVFLYAFIIAFSRLADDFAADSDLTLGRAGWVLAVAALVAATGLVLCLIGMREWARPPRPGSDPEGTSNDAIIALVLGLAGIGGVTAALAVAFAVLGLGEVRLSEGTRRGRGMAIAGLVLGVVTLAFWVLILAVGMFAVSPSSGNG